MALTQKVTEIIEKAAEIEKLNLWEQGKAAKALLKDDVVPVLLTMAQFIDGTPQTGVVSIGDMSAKIEKQGAEIAGVLQFNEQLKAQLANTIEQIKPLILQLQSAVNEQQAEIEGMREAALKAAELQSDISLQVAALKKDAVAAKKPAAKKPLPAVTA